MNAPNPWRHLDINRDPYGNTFDTNPWNDARSYAPDLYDSLAIVEHYEKLARKARRDEITDGLIWLGWGAGAALLLVVGVLYFGGVF